MVHRLSKYMVDEEWIRAWVDIKRKAQTLGCPLINCSLIILLGRDLLLISFAPLDVELNPTKIQCLGL